MNAFYYLMNIALYFWRNIYKRYCTALHFYRIEHCLSKCKMLCWPCCNMFYIFIFVVFLSVFLSELQVILTFNLLWSIDISQITNDAFFKWGNRFYSDYLHFWGNPSTPIRYSKSSVDFVDKVGWGRTRSDRGCMENLTEAQCDFSISILYKFSKYLRSCIRWDFC